MHKYDISIYKNSILEKEIIDISYVKMSSVAGQITYSEIEYSTLVAWGGRFITYDFISKRLAPEVILNDGKQTPMRGHPVFIAQHATATCCRSCLYKWHKIKPDKELNCNEINYIVNLIMLWIAKQDRN